MEPYQVRLLEALGVPRGGGPRRIQLGLLRRHLHVGLEGLHRRLRLAGAQLRVRQRLPRPGQLRRGAVRSSLGLLSRVLCRGAHSLEAGA